ncbi:hypothetical protein [Arthrobacter sp. H20]|uniref:hypothetical protein n=1 Tax=Arthrobacter sp. H20 TaxID=1267981 RepID=UPI0012DEE834|nr:hypothetical protein [Arthrobacter sp. H20]
MNADEDPGSRVPWALLCGLIIMLNASNYALQSGQCTDYITGSGATSTCSLEPALGWPGSVLLAMVSLVVLGYCINRLLRLSR